MDNRTMKMFLATYESRSISKAAKEVYFTKQNISKSLKSLEEELNIELFNKIKDGVEPTEECHKLYGIIKDLNENVDEIEAYYRVKNNPYSVRVADNNVEIISKYYNMAIAKYYDENVMYTYENIEGKEIFDRLITNQCDIGIFPIPMEREEDIRKICDENNIELELLLETGPSVFVRNAHPLAKLKEVTATDLVDYKRIDLNRADIENWFFTKYLEKNNIEVNAEVKTNGVSNVVASLKDVDYYFISLYFENDTKYLKDLKMIPFNGTGLQILLFLGYKRDRLYEDVAKYFMELVTRHYRGEEIED